MAPTEDLNLPEGGETESAADSSPEGTEQEVPEAEMAAAVPETTTQSKMSTPGPESNPPSTESSSIPAKDVKEDAVQKDQVSESSNNHRGSTFLTEVEDCDEVGPEVASIVSDKVEVLGPITDVDKKETTPAKEVTPADAKEEKSNPTKESSPSSVKEESPAPTKDASPTPVKEVSPEKDKDTSAEPIKETSPVPVKETSPVPVKETSQILGSEPIGAVEDLKAEVNALLSSPDAKKDETENVEVIDIAVVEESKESANKGASEIEDVLNKIPEKQQIIEEAKESLKDIDIQPKESGSVIDISVIEEPQEDVDAVEEIVKTAQEAFVAEVIPDNADVEIVPDEGEKVIEYTLNSADAIPIGAIAVAAFAIFLALIFYYN